MMNPDNFFLVFSPAWFLISFFAYWPLFFRHIGRGEARKIIPLRFYGAIVFGLIPVLISFFAGYDIREIFGLRLDIHTGSGIWLISVAAGILIIVFNIFLTRRRENLDVFPQIRNREWTTGLIIGDILSWLVYITGYEFLFRGLLFFPLLDAIGFMPAAMIGTVIYSLSHYPKSLKEAIGAIPFGFLLVFLAWQSHSVWICVWLHACLAISNSILSFYHHPDMRLVDSSAKNKEG
jgi:hypothetical protein